MFNTDEITGRIMWVSITDWTSGDFKRVNASVKSDSNNLLI